MTLLIALVVALAAAQDYRDYLCVEIKRPFFEEGGPSGSRMVRLARRDAHPISFPTPKPPKTRRILVVGESVAAKLRDPKRDALTEAAARAWPGWKVEAVNAGMTAYNSRRIAAVLEEGLAYEPDLLIVLSGNNEHDALEPCPSVWDGLERQFKRTSLYTRLASEKRSPEEHVRELSLRRHEFHLRRMAGAAKKRGVALLFATLPANERDYPPSGEAGWSDRDFARGMAAAQRRDWKGAAEAFGYTLKRAPGDSFARWFLARALEASGRPALAEYLAAVRSDPRGDRSSAERNAMIRRVAADEGAGVVDLEAAFRSAAGGGAIGAAYLADGVHWHSRLNPFVAREIMRSAHGLGAAGLEPVDEAAVRAAGPAGPSPRERREELLKSLLYGVRAASYWAGTDRDGAINEVPVAMLDVVDREERAWLLELSKSQAAMRPKLTANFWVRDLAEDQPAWWPVYLLHLGEMYRRKGEPKLALGFFDQALALSPKRRRIRLWRALTLKALDRASEAAAEMKELAASGDPAARSVSSAYGF